MASEFSPAGQGARMTKAQIRKYMREMKQKREEAKKKLEEFENSGEFQKEQEELQKLEQQLAELHEESNFPSSSDTTTDTTNWKILTKEEFFNKEKLYKKFLGFTIYSANLKDIFSISANKYLYNTVETYLAEQQKTLQNLCNSEKYEEYLYAKTNKQEIIIQTK